VFSPHRNHFISESHFSSASRLQASGMGMRLVALRSNFNFWKEVTGAKATIKNPALEEPVYSIYFAAPFRHSPGSVS
jgi:hypothetical protein